MPTKHSQHIALLFLLVALIATPLIAQASDPDSLSSERRRALLSELQDDEEMTLGGKIFLDRVEYTETQVRAFIEVNWVDGSQLIRDMVVKAKLQVKVDNDRGKYKDIEGLNAEGRTDGLGRVEIAIQLPSHEGLMPGEYFVVVSIEVPTQSKEVIAAMRNDSRIYGTDMTTKKLKDEAFQRLLTGDLKVPPTQHKIYVSPKSYWVDDGSITDWRKIDERVTALRNHEYKQVQIQEWLKGEGSGKDATAEQRKQWRDELDQIPLRIKAAREYLEMGGGPIKDKETDAVNRAKQKQKQMVAEIDVFHDELFEHYVNIIEVDIAYWRWLLVELYGMNIDKLLRTGELPWENSNLRLKSANEKEWKRYLKDLMEKRIKGDDANPNKPVYFSEDMLSVVHRDIDSFDIMKFVTRDADKKYDLDEVRWMEFEQNILSAIHYKEEAPEPKRFKSYAKTTKRSTGDRIRDLDLSRAYGYQPTPFATPYSHLADAFKYLAYLPKSYRYQWYKDSQIIGLSNKDIIQRIAAEDFPTFAQISAKTAVKKIDSEIGLTKKAFNDAFDAIRLGAWSYDSHPIYHIWFYTTGAGRYYPEKNRSNGVNAAQERMDRRRDR